MKSALAANKGVEAIYPRGFTSGVTLPHLARSGLKGDANDFHRHSRYPEHEGN
jgi:hypothetical protein